MDEKQPVIKLTDVENMGIFLMAHGTVDGVEVQAPFHTMIVDGECQLEGGVYDLLRQAKWQKDNPMPDSGKSVKEDKPEPVVSEPVDYSAQEAKVAEVHKKWLKKIAAVDLAEKRGRGYL